MCPGVVEVITVEAFSHHHVTLPVFKPSSFAKPLRYSAYLVLALNAIHSTSVVVAIVFGVRDVQSRIALNCVMTYPVHDSRDSESLAKSESLYPINFNSFS